MDNLRHIKQRIRGITNIRHITRAMKLVASARLHKAQAQLLAARPYADRMREAIIDIAVRTPGIEHPLLQTHPAGRPALMILTSDKGLCAGFNAQPLQRGLRSRLTPGPEGPPELLAVGRKAVQFFRRAGLGAVREWAGFWQDLGWTHADMLGSELIALFAAGRWSRITLVYNRFKSMLAQELVEEPLLPLAFCLEGCPPARSAEYAFEPSAEAVLSSLLPRYVKISLWHALLESKAAELAARMQAMGNATDSAGDMIEELTLHLNRARQANITREISELVGGAEAIQA